jgi:5-formyltetrahydrofolate cyclo-ligase
VALSLPSLSSARKPLRAELRARRRSLSPTQRTLAAEAVARNLDQAFPLRAGQRVAIYAAMREELDTAPLIERALERGCRVFLPRIERRSGRIHFVETHLDCEHSPNHLGILEPQGTARVEARFLNLVLLPLVGFDERGVRLGMGGGYYDRTFAWRNVHTSWRGPHLIGLAYAFQQLPSIAAAAHDVRMDAVVTDKGVVRCRTG